MIDIHISFVILHYITIEDTIECITSIENNIKYKDKSIIVVDNGSPNGTGDKLLEKYKDNDTVHIIISKENLGFAKGNNLGFKYAKHNKKADFIVMINNDTYINQENFCYSIINEYEREKFHICGPNIISLVDNQKQNPIPRLFNNIQEVKNKVSRFKILMSLSYISGDVIMLKIVEFKNRLKKNNNHKEERNDYKLHGSCMIFSPIFIDKYEGLYDKTFMYGEEDILRYIADRDGLNMFYSENMTIYHKEDSATNASLNKGGKKRRFYYKNSIDSCNELINLMDKTIID